MRLEDASEAASFGALNDGAAPAPAVVRAERPRRWRRRLAWSALGLVALVVLYELVTFAQVYRAAHRDGARPAQAIIVLGAAQYDGRPSPVLAARLDHALGLWRDGLAPVIVVTGGRQEGDRFTEATAAANYLIERGVPDAQILREVQGASSWESLAASARILRARDIDDVLLVSDPYHAYRIDAIASEVGLNASVSSAAVSSSWRDYARETAAVSVGRIVGFRRMLRLTS